MRLLTFVTPAKPRQPRLGAMLGEEIVDLVAAQKNLGGRNPIAASSKRLLASGNRELGRAAQLLDAVQSNCGDLPPGIVLKQDEIRFPPPIPDAEKFLCLGKNYHTPRRTE